jgi:hypothetical protein
MLFLLYILYMFYKFNFIESCFLVIYIAYLLLLNILYLNEVFAM